MWFGNDSPRRTRAGQPSDGIDDAEDDVPTVKIRSARSLPPSPDSSGQLAAATPAPGTRST